MECLALTFGIQAAKQLNGSGLWCGSKSKHRYIDLLAVALDFIGDHVFHISIALFAGAKGHGHCCHIFTGCGRMSLIDDYGKPLAFQVLYTVHDIGELLNGSCNDFGIAI